MSFSKVAICNKALNHLGQKPIASLSENSEAAIRLSYVYDICRDAVLRSSRWGFATRIGSLALISGETIIGWTYLYAYPSDSVLLHKVFTDKTRTNPDPVEYKVVNSPVSLQRTIACNDSPAYVEYTASIDDPTQYDAIFVEALALKLAAETAFVLTGKEDLATKLVGMTGAYISETKRIDSTQQNITDESDTGYIAARA